jgi:hypothetical protein
MNHHHDAATHTHTRVAGVCAHGLRTFIVESGQRFLRNQIDIREDSHGSKFQIQNIDSFAFVACSAATRAQRAIYVVWDNFNHFKRQKQNQPPQVLRHDDYDPPAKDGQQGTRRLAGSFFLFLCLDGALEGSPNGTS